MAEAAHDALAFPVAVNMTCPFFASRGVPTSYVIDRHGIVRDIEIGIFTPKRLNAVILPLLAEPRP